MGIDVKCDVCGATYNLPESMLGSEGVCECGATFEIRGTDSETTSVSSTVEDDADEKSSSENAFATPQAVMVEAIPSSNVRFSASDIAGLRNVATSMNFICLIPLVAMIGCGISFLIGMAVGGCDGLAAFIYGLGMTAVALGVVGLLSYIWLAMAPSASGARPFVHLAFWLPLVINIGADVQIELFDGRGEEYFIIAVIAIAANIFLATIAIDKILCFIGDEQVRVSLKSYCWFCLISCAIVGLVLTTIRIDEDDLAWLLSLGGLVVLIWGWTLARSVRESALAVISQNGPVAGVNAES